MALTCHGDDVSESEPEHQDMLDEGLALRREVARSHLARLPSRGRFFKRYLSWSVDRVLWHGDLAKAGQFILSSSWN